MPKLNDRQIKEVEKSEEWGDGFALLPPGRYAAELVKVEERPGVKAPQWSWEFSNLHDPEGKAYSGRQWYNTSFSEKALGNLKHMFNVLGYTLDTGTDEMLGEWATLVITKETQAVGKRAGQEVNRVQAVATFDPEEFDFDVAEVPTAVQRSVMDDDPAF